MAVNRSWKSEGPEGQEPRPSGAAEPENVAYRPSQFNRPFGTAHRWRRLPLERTVESVVEVRIGRRLGPLLVGGLLAATIATSARGPGIAHRRLPTICGRGLSRRATVVALLLAPILT